MVRVELVDRKGPALSPSALRCLSHMPTVNITAGCAHGCIYCYIRGYSGYPGDGVVRVYRNTASQVAQELARKRRKPVAVYFCPSSDAFQSIPEVLEQSYQTMRTLLAAGVGVQFVTKGAIPDRVLELFALFPHLVAGQIGLCTLDQAVTDLLEPAAAPVVLRLDLIRRLTGLGIETAVRADPLIHGLTDTNESLQALLTAVRHAGVRQVSASYLFLRPAIRGSLRRNIPDPRVRDSIVIPYATSAALGLRGGRTLGLPLPLPLRQAGFARLRQLAGAIGITIHICGCKNGDLTQERCNLTQVTMAGRAHLHAGQASSQASLWPSAKSGESV